MDVTEVVAAGSSAVAALAAVGVAWLAIQQGRKARAQLETQSIDARAPVVVLTLRSPDWPPYEPSVAYGRAPQPLHGSAAEWRMPGQATQRRIMIVVKGELRNIGVTPALVTIGEGGRFLLGEPDDELALVDPPLGTDATESRRRTIHPGKSAWAVFISNRTSGEWQELAMTTHARTMATCSVTVTTDDMFDRGMTDTLTVMLRGRVLVGTEQDAGRWRLPDPHLTAGVSQIVNAEATPVVRSYWASRINGRPLAALGYEEP